MPKNSFAIPPRPAARPVLYGRRPDLAPLEVPSVLQAIAAHLDSTCAMRLLPQGTGPVRKSILGIWTIPFSGGLFLVTLRAHPGGHSIALQDRPHLRDRFLSDVQWVQKLTEEYGNRRISADLAFTAIFGYGRECVTEQRLFIAPLLPQPVFQEWRDALLPLLPAQERIQLSAATMSTGLSERLSLPL